MTSAEQASETLHRRKDLRYAAVGGFAAAVVGFGGMAVVGTASDFEARRLIDAVLPTARFAASAYVAGGATILALMLTLLTFSITHDLQFHRSHYQRIREISTLTTAVIASSVMLLMFLSFPLDETGVERGYRWVYYAILLGGATTGGVFIAVVLMLFYAIRQLISLGEGDATDSLIVDQDEKPTEEQAG